MREGGRGRKSRKREREREREREQRGEKDNLSIVVSFHSASFKGHH